ncbi:MAG TPA: ferredoxin [Tissierellaceae bacterium]|nr:ferredoxin [Tissierellaceae bacterium]
MKAMVDRDACIGCELCTTICPEVFEMDDEQIAIVVKDVVPTDMEAEAEDARDSCPTSAISLEE